MQLFHRNSCKMSVDCFRETRRGGLVRPASKSSRFSHHPLRVPKAWHRDFAACGQRSGLLALNLASIFEKLLDQKTFIYLRLVSYNQYRKKLRTWILSAVFIVPYKLSSRLIIFQFRCRMVVIIHFSHMILHIFQNLSIRCNRIPQQSHDNRLESNHQQHCR